MKNLKSVKETAKTFTMTFEFHNQDELKNLKALSILLGNYNSMKDEILEKYSVLEILEQEKEKGSFSFIISNITKCLK
jgi:hypothetical protein